MIRLGRRPPTFVDLERGVRIVKEHERRFILADVAMSVKRFRRAKLMKLDIPRYVGRFDDGQSPREAFAVVGEIRLGVRDRSGSIQIHVYDSERDHLERRPPLDTLVVSLGQSFGSERRDSSGRVVAPPARTPTFAEALNDPAFAQALRSIAGKLAEWATVHPAMRSAVIREM